MVDMSSGRMTCGRAAEVGPVLVVQGRRGRGCGMGVAFAEMEGRGASGLVDPGSVNREKPGVVAGGSLLQFVTIPGLVASEKSADPRGEFQTCGLPERRCPGTCFLCESEMNGEDGSVFPVEGRSNCLGAHDLLVIEAGNRFRRSPQSASLRQIDFEGPPRLFVGLVPRFDARFAATSGTGLVKAP